MSSKLVGYDFIRSVTVLTVFLAHILGKQITNAPALLVIGCLSPGLTMSLLGFLSAVLLSNRNRDQGAFLVRRFSRIYIPLALCLIAMLSLHALIGKHAFNQHMVLHFMGLSAFLELFQVHNKATVGAGLWFITVILVMYLILPLIERLFHHPRRLLHLVVLVTAITTLDLFMYDVQSTWNVVISFTVGVYITVGGQLKRLIESRSILPIFGAAGLLAVVALATANVIPYAVRHLLYAFYPIAFVPLLFKVAEKLPKPVVAASAAFAALSYEFYILHFYFINQSLKDFFPFAMPLFAQVILSFLITLTAAFLISKCAVKLSKVTEAYLLKEKIQSFAAPFSAAQRTSAQNLSPEN